MKKYYVNNRAQSNGDHEVHVAACSYFPSFNTYLGEFASCEEAVAKAQKTYPKSNGCAICCKPCHTT